MSHSRDEMARIAATPDSSVESQTQRETYKRDRRFRNAASPRTTKMPRFLSKSAKNMSCKRRKSVIAPRS